MKGQKFDSDKVRSGLLLGGFARSLNAVAQVGTFGANKYVEDGWIEVPDGINRYTDALYRHLLTEESGQACDEESQLLHAAHTGWNALARLDLMLRAEN